jgi:hypothetical protein
VTLSCPTPSYAQGNFDDDGFAQLNSEQSDQVLQLFRQSRIPGNFFLKFNIIHKPRLGENKKPVEGALWAGWADFGPQVRGEIFDSDGQTQLSFVAVKNFKQSSLWISNNLKPAQAGNSHEASEPIVPGLILSAFDINLPFTHWKETKYTATLRSRGRGVHFFEALNPTQSEPAKVVYGIDRTFGALTEATYYSQTGKITRTLKIEDFAKVDGQWMVSTCSIRDETTRDIDVLKITDAAVRINLLEQTFTPESLVEKAKFPTPAELKNL